MSQQIKFSDEEVKKFRDAENKGAQIVNQVGQLELQILSTQENLEQLQAKKQQLVQQNKQLAADIDKFVKELSEKYGEGTLNVETGVFTPAENQTEPGSTEKPEKNIENPKENQKK